MHRLSGQVAKSEIVDLDGDGSHEIVVGVQGSGQDVGTIMALSARGEVLWSADTTAPYNYSGGGSGQMAIRNFAVADLFDRDTLQIVALATDAQGWYQSRLTIIDEHGKELSGYWHPGHLHHLAIGARSQDQPRRIIVAGLNNDLRTFLGVRNSIPVVFAFDPLAVSGEAPPYLGKIKSGSHLWYGIITPEINSVRRLDVVDRNGDGVNEISVWTTQDHIFYLDFDGRVIGKASGDGVKGTATFRLLR